jgi:hypothetical protein
MSQPTGEQLRNSRLGQIGNEADWKRTQYNVTPKFDNGVPLPPESQAGRLGDIGGAPENVNPELLRTPEEHQYIQAMDELKQSGLLPQNTDLAQFNKMTDDARKNIRLNLDLKGKESQSFSPETPQYRKANAIAEHLNATGGETEYQRHVAKLLDPDGEGRITADDIMAFVDEVPSTGLSVPRAKRTIYTPEERLKRRRDKLGIVEEQPKGSTLGNIGNSFKKMVGNERGAGSGAGLTALGLYKAKQKQKEQKK